MHLRLYGLGLYRVGAGVVAAGYKYYNCSECCKRLLTLTRVSDATERLPLVMYVSHIHSESSSCRPYCLGIGYLPLLGLQHSVGQLCRLQFNVWVLQRLQIAMLAYALLLRLCSATAATLLWHDATAQNTFC